MQNRIDAVFERLKQQNRKALVAYITGGDPDLPRSFEVAAAIAEAGADLLEIGVPFSDPLADGPTIQAAAGRALASGSTVPSLLAHLREFRKKSQVPVVLFTYLNPIFVYGYEKFVRDACEAGADGLLILDLPPDEAARNQDLSLQHGLHPIQLIAPTTPESRVAQIAASARGFIYYVSREGVTGERQELASTIGDGVALIRKYSSLPVCVGFGVSSPDQAAEVARQSDGAVVGSAFVRKIAELSSSPSLPSDIHDFVKPFADAVHASL